MLRCCCIDILSTEVRRQLVTTNSSTVLNSITVYCISSTLTNWRQKSKSVWTFWTSFTLHFLWPCSQRQDITIIWFYSTLNEWCLKIYFCDVLKEQALWLGCFYLFTCLLIPASTALLQVSVHWMLTALSLPIRGEWTPGGTQGHCIFLWLKFVSGFKYCLSTE